MRPSGAKLEKVAGDARQTGAEATRILVVIANYGTKNLKYLQVLLAEYRRMPFQVDIIILSNEPKQFGPDVEVRVGLPTKNPWSLPFAYKPLLAERSQDYDLFIYTEDDVLITERNIRAFLRATEVLPEDYIAGFIRYEVADAGKRYYSTVHGSYHWEVQSVIRRGEFTFAHFTNDHSGCLMVTKQQLGRALASGGFLRGFRRGRYGYPETAATDLYTQCGFKKVIGISHLEDFCLAHLPNVYVGKLGVGAEVVEGEIVHLMSLNGGGEILGPLFQTETRLPATCWDKQFYEAPRLDVLAEVPGGGRTVLSVGCGWGATEQKLRERGVTVVGIPLDCVVAVSARARGIETVLPSLDAARQQMAGRRFDCIIFGDCLHRFKEPVAVLRDYLSLLEPRGCVVVSAPNFNYLRVLRDRLSGRVKLRRLSFEETFTRYGLHLTTLRRVKRWLRQSGLNPVEARREVPERYRWADRLSFGLARGMLVENLVVVGKPRPR
jgi:2-polyprenyl-3-methyl-5-hydroxy-6-metoxy-1,4-benzoquinol methylase